MKFDGPDVTNETLALLTPERAAVCQSLRTLTFEDTRVTKSAVERVKALLPHVTVKKR